MNKIKNTIKHIWVKYKKYILIGLPVLLAILFLILRHGNNNGEVYVVSKANVEQSVVLSGQVMTSDRADLGFAAGGRVEKIFIKNNQKVSQGQILAQLEIGDLAADLKIKQANSRTSDVDLEAAKEDLDKITTQENTKVESAYRTLLSEALVLIPDSDEYDMAPPTISGIYDGVEGEYKIVVERDNENASDSQIRIFGLEKSIRTINNSSSTQLGTRGLYISFPGEPEDYRGTTWLLNIPNKASSSYLSNYNAYNEAKKARDAAIQSAEFKYKKLLTEGTSGENAGVAQAEIQKINAEIRKNTIYAPFAGIVTNIEKEVGENASAAERIISIIGEDTLEVVLQVSELDVSRIAPGTTIKITLDAFPGETFEGILKTINSRETEVEGVPVYEAFVELKPDARIKTGMSANGTVVIATKENVLAIPSYLVKKTGNVNTVEVINQEGKTRDTEVTVGLMGTDSMVEIISGLSEGDTIVLVPKK